MSGHNHASGRNTRARTPVRKRQVAAPNSEHMAAYARAISEIVPTSSARPNRDKRWENHGDIIGWSAASSDLPTPSAEFRVRTTPSEKKLQGSRTQAPSVSRDALAGVTSAGLKKDVHVYEPGHRRLLGTPRVSHRAAAHRGTTWQSETGVMPALDCVPRTVQSSLNGSAPKPKSAVVLHRRDGPPVGH
eukprot:6208887-Pleurochrysis_carterae.AAC.3